MPTLNAQNQGPESTDMVEGLKPWVTPRVIVASAEHAEKLAGYGDYLYSGTLYGS